MRKLRLALFIILLLLVAGSALFYWLSPHGKMNIKIQGDTPPPSAAGPSGQKAVDARAENKVEPQVKEVTYSHVEDGVRKWGLLADGGDFDPATGYIALQKVRVTYYRDNGGHFYLEGDTGQYDQEKQIVIVTGNVLGRNDKNVTIKTNKLVYVSNQQMVETNEAVTVAGPNFSITSQGLKVYLEPQQVEFTGKVNSVFWPKAGEGALPGLGDTQAQG